MATPPNIPFKNLGNIDPETSRQIRRNFDEVAKSISAISTGGSSTNFWEFGNVANQLAINTATTAGMTEARADVTGSTFLQLKDDGSTGLLHRVVTLSGTEQVNIQSTTTDVSITGRDVTHSSTRNSFLIGNGVSIQAGGGGTIVGTITGAGPCTIEGNPIVLATRLNFDGKVPATGPVGAINAKIPVYAGDGSTIVGYLPVYASIT